MNQDGIMPLNTSTENRFQYNGKELEKDGGIDLSDYGARWYDASLGRFTGVDPIADEFAWVSPFNYAENEPVGYIDLWGLQKADPVTVSGGSLPEVTVSATSGIHDQSVDRYGYYSDWSQYKHEFGLEGWSYDNAMNYWLSVYADDFDAETARLDAEQKAREDVARMLHFGTYLAMEYTVVSLGSEVSLPAVRGFSLRGFGVKGASSAFKIAQSGGRHAGFLENYAGRSSSEINKAINSLQNGKRGINVHLDKIANPSKYVPNWNVLRVRHQHNLIKGWQSEITNARQQIVILRAILKNK